ncbi:hypothetical protein OAL72_00960 [bacterium]|nr:hypothetical protein [bacterium]
MNSDTKYSKPEGSPELIRFKYLGDDMLLDFNERELTAVCGVRKFTFEQIFKYLVDEGFLLRDEEGQSNNKHENN